MSLHEPLELLLKVLLPFLIFFVDLLLSYFELGHFFIELHGRDEVLEGSKMQIVDLGGHG